VIQLPSGDVIGTGSVQFIEWDAIPRISQSWTHKVYLNLYQATDAVLVNQQIRTSMECSTDCTITGTNPPDGPTWLRLNQPLYGEYYISAPATAITYSAERLDTWYWNAAVPGSEAYVGLPEVPTARCETLAYFQSGGACVFPEIGGLFELSESDPAVSGSASFIIYSEINLPDHWRADYTDLIGPGLHRLADKTRIDQNRDTSCAGFVKQDANDSCDEYPFASTYEGAAIVGLARTSVGHVPLIENTTAGSRLGAEYKLDRIVDDGNTYDAFWVAILN